MFLYFLFRYIFNYLKIYVGGAWYFLVQLTQTHRNLHDIPLQTGKVAIVTGGAYGIGFHVSKGLVARNVHVIIGAHSERHGKEAVAAIREEFPNAKVDYIQLDLSSLKSTRNFAECFLERNLPLHILVNNAGIMLTPYAVTCDGLESQMQVNYLSHTYLTQLLLDRLRESGEDHSFARIVNVSSCVHHFATDTAKNVTKTCHGWFEYSSHEAYCNSKLAIIAATYALDRKLSEEGSRVSVCALHPGVVKSDLYRHAWLVHNVAMGLLGFLYWTPAQGADTPLFAALSPEVEGQSGCYFDNSKKCRSSVLSYSKDFQEELWRNTILTIERTSD